MRRTTLACIFALTAAAGGLWIGGREGAAQTQSATSTQTAPATSTAPSTAPATAPGPRGLMSLRGAEGVQLESIDFDIEICGALAETTVTLKFYNPGERVSDGTLIFPLPEGAVISGYGLDVGGVMVDGVPVEKYRTRQIFESEMRKRVDPGFVEQTSANTFTTRVYPIDPKKTRTAKIKYVQQLASAASDGKSPREMRYVMPMAWMGTIKESTINIATDAAELPKVEGLPAIEFLKLDGKCTARKYFQRLSLDGDLVVKLPENRAERAWVERRVRSETIEDVISGKAARQEEFYFMAAAAGHSEAKKAQAGVLETINGKSPAIALYWDASLSRQTGDKTADFAFIEALARKMGKGRIDVTIFRDACEPTETFEIEKGDASRLIDRLKAAPRDGATNFSAIHFGGAYQLALLFSDGAATMGGMPQRSEIPVVALCSSVVANDTLLKKIAEASPSGMQISLAGSTIQGAVDRVASHDFSDAWTIEADPAQIADVYASTLASGNESITATGRLLVDEAKLTLKNRGASHEIILKRSAATDTSLISRHWAGRRIAELSAMPAHNAEALRGIGREFAMVTANTSLMVLETVDQYWQYQVVPPRSQEKLFTAFADRLKQEMARDTKVKDDPLTWAWESRVMWWDNDFSKVPATQPADSPDRQRQIALLFRDADTLLQQLQYPEAAAAFRHILVLDPNNYAAKAALRLTEDTMLFRTFEKLNQVQGQEFLKQEIISKELLIPYDTITGGWSNGEVMGPQTLDGWKHDAAYLPSIMAADKTKAYDVYLSARKKFVSTPAFYLACSNYFAQIGQKEIARRILSNVLELSPGSTNVLRIVACRLLEFGDLDLAIEMFEEIKARREGDNQTWCDLARAYAKRGLARYRQENDRAAGQQDFRAAIADLSRAMDAYHRITRRDWRQFVGVEQIALVEANDLWAKIQKLPGFEKVAGDFRNPFDKRLIKQLDCDLRVVITWDIYPAKVHLLVDEAGGGGSGLYSAFSNRGGYIVRSNLYGNCTEEYSIRKAPAGNYKFSVQCEQSLWEPLTGPLAAEAVVITNFGRPDEKRETFKLRLMTGQTEVVCEKEMK